MSQDAEIELLQLAQRRGYLLCQGPQPLKKRLAKLWRRECLQSGNPVVLVTKHYLCKPRRLLAMIQADLYGKWWLSRELWAAIQAEMKVGTLKRFGNSVRIDEIPPRETTQVADKFMDVLVRHRPSPAEAFEIPAALVRGRARCVYADGLESLLTESESYIIREIPNMLGHVVVFRPSTSPLVGIHLERFELFTQTEESAPAP